MSEAVDIEFDEDKAEVKSEGFARAGSEQDSFKGEIPSAYAEQPGLESSISRKQKS